MHKTQNFDILLPASEEIIEYGKNDISIEEWLRIAGTIGDFDLYVKIENVWSEKTRQAHESGRTIYSRPKYRLEHYKYHNGKIKLWLGPTNYREFLGTNVEAGRDDDYMKNLISRGKKRYDDPDAFFSNQLAIASSVETLDGKIIMGLNG